MRRAITSYSLRIDVIDKLVRLKTELKKPMGHIIEDLINAYQIDKRVWHSVEIPIEPKVKKRPRFGKYTTYKDEQTIEYEATVKGYLKEFWEDRPPLAAGVELQLVFKFKYPATSKYGFPGGMDIDNLIKSVFDAANGVIWQDDRQVNKLSNIEKVFAEEEGIEIRFAESMLDWSLWKRLKHNWKFIGAKK